MVSRRNFLKISAACLAIPAVFGMSNTLWAQPTHLRVRKNLMTLADNDPFFEKYGEAVKAMHALPDTDLRSWWGQATIHADYCQHGTLNFVSWHRPYIAMFEEICGELIGDSNFTLHYWDWSKKNGIIPNPFYDNPLLNVTHWNDPGEYNGINWGRIDSLPIRALQKGTGLQSDPVRSGSFTERNLQTILRQSSFVNFNNMLERQPHNNGHVIAGFPARGLPGHIGDGLSPLDPIFWMHHCMVDYMWAKWQAAGNTTQDNDETYSDMFVDKDGNPITFTSQQVRDFTKLGYTYDDLIGKERFEAMLKNAEISSAFQATLAEQLKSAKSMSLGTKKASITASVGEETSLSAKTTNLLRNLQSSRVFRTTLAGEKLLATEGARVIAVLKNVGWPQGGNNGLVVNVFVNCPYLTPETPSTDPHYAGSFGFFGSAKTTSMEHGTSVMVDITAPLTAQAGAGRLNDDIKVQLMPVNAAAESKNTASFTVTDLEIIRLD
ncbi:tyrosinase family protein [Nitrosomonas sp. Nm34]|uniref:tyrosinase family protein n=1 Tax=Nitrosomonas sp. Nm34 TaxID=1881055 RepID=UPI0008E3FC6B|nr:tyrosinase family protein [Nitrosomonas sp. Nm34]SFI45910.1 tyrosinase [Nitrosomonas sp. Nm34]